MNTNKNQRAIIVSPSHWGEMQVMLEDMAEISHLTSLEALKKLPPGEAPDVIFVDTGAFREALCGNGGVPGAAVSYVVSISTDDDPAGMRIAMRAGARDFLMPPFTPEMFGEIFQRARAMRSHVAHEEPENPNEPASASAPEKSAEVITFFTTKGGAGKSTLAANFATALTRENPDTKVCLLDMDLQFGDIAMIFDAKPRATIIDIIQESGGISPDICSFLCAYDKQLAILPAPLHPEESELVRPEHVTAIIETLRTQFDFIIIDTGAALNDVLLTILDKSNQVFLVVTPLILSLKNLKRVLDVMTGTLGYDEHKIRIILNRSDSINGIRDKEIENLCGKKIDYFVPSEGNVVVQSINMGRPAVAVNPRCKFARALGRMAASVSEPPAAPLKKSLFSFFSKPKTGKKPEAGRK